MNKSALIILVGFLTLLTTFDKTAFAQSLHTLSISRHQNVAISDGQADTILMDAGSILQDDNDGAGSNDVPCNVVFQRDGAVSKFTTSAPAIIASQGDLTAVFAEPTYVKVVSSIGYCENKAGNYAGCAIVGKGSMIVKRIASNRPIEALAWTHEFGHTSNLGHNKNNTDAVMYEKGSATNDEVDMTECEAFTIGVPLIETAERNHKDDSEKEKETISLQDFARLIIIDTIPWKEINAYHSSDLSPLIGMLNTHAESLFWPNVLTILGVIGDETAIDIIHDVLNAEMTGLGASTITPVKTASIFALGYLANRFPESDAFSVLLPYSTDRGWSKNTKWMGVDDEARSATLVQLKKIAMLALALSGDEKSMVLFSQKQKRLVSIGATGEPVDFIGELQSINSAVAESGLSNYYK